MEEQSETLDVQIKGISEIPDKKTSPIVGYFSSAFDPLKNLGEPESGAGSSVKIFRKQDSQNPKQPRIEVVVGVGGSDVNYVGTNYSGEARTPQLCNYALGVLDKATGVLKMVPIAANKIFRLEPRVVGLEQPENERPDVDDSPEKLAEKRRIVTLKYGQKRSITRDAKREILRQTEDAEALKGMEDKLKGVVVKMDALEGIESAVNARNIPYYNMEAGDSEMAYPLDKIILEGDWDYLQDIFEIVHGGSELSSDVYPRFVCNRVHKVQNVKDESRSRRMAGILSYITHLIHFKDRHSMDGVSSAKHHKLPSILSQRFSDMFAPSKEKRIQSEKLNLLINYVLVLSLFADNFQSDPTDIAKDLRMNTHTLRDNYGYLGCKIKRGNQGMVVTLPVPLEFETQKRKRGKRR